MHHEHYARKMVQLLAACYVFDILCYSKYMDFNTMKEAWIFCMCVVSFTLILFNAVYWRCQTASTWLWLYYVWIYSLSLCATQILCLPQQNQMISLYCRRCICCHLIYWNHNSFGITDYFLMPKFTLPSYFGEFCQQPNAFRRLMLFLLLNVSIVVRMCAYLVH